MKLHVVARGRIGRCPEAELVDRYLKRISWPVLVTELSDSGAGKLPDPLSPHFDIVLDERGKTLPSLAFAEKLGRWRDDGMREARFWIGAADGHDAKLRDGAGLLLSLGAATWPHMLARAMLAEQLYRATAILAGHPYHRE